MKLAGAVAVIVALCASDRAAGDAWPTPAAGESASGGPEVVFTFDDGPHPHTTPMVLDILAQHRIRAVFFLVGRRARHHPSAPDIIRRIVREGHVIATHTMEHKDPCDIPVEEAASDIDDGKAIVERIAGIPTAWFRTPFGARCGQLELLLAARRLTHFHWDLDPQEWKYPHPRHTVRYITRELGWRRGRNVVLLHDVKRATVKALPQILDWIADENARRAQELEPPIRIVPAAEVAVEQIPLGLRDWLRASTATIRGLPAAIASVLP